MIKFSVHFTKIIAILLLLKHKSVYKVIFSQRGIKAKDVNTFSTTAKIKKNSICCSGQHCNAYAQ